MLIIVHRAQAQAHIPAGFGIELDVRDHNGEVVVSHDPVGKDAEVETLNGWLVRNAPKRGFPLIAFNHKADGIEATIARIATNPLVADRCFVFDMPFPAEMRYASLGVRVAERVSDVEPYAKRHDVVWLDRWFWDTEIPRIIDEVYTAPFIYVVSPELHRPTWGLERIKAFWRLIPKWVEGVCTDYWREADQFFNGGKV